MINLIPIGEKKRIAQNFYWRLFVVFFGMLGFSFIVGALTLLPSYFFSLVKKNAADLRLEMQKQEVMPQVDQETLAAIKDLQSKLAVIENAEQNKFSVSEKIVQEIVSKKMPDIKITQISYSVNSTKQRKVNVTGIAPDRERLLLFRQVLEEDPTFTKVDLPISNFVKGSNIEFYLTLIPSTQNAKQ